MKFKKFAIALLAVALFVLSAAIFVACDPKPKACADGEHDWQVVSNTATCVAAGVKRSECTKCKQIKEENVPAMSETLTHTWDMDNVDVDVEATCEHAGSGSAQCTVCGATDVIEIPKLAHNITKPDFKNMRSATCTKEGVVAGYCSLCNKNVNETTPALGHDFSGTVVVISEATCETDGESQVACKRPGCDGGENGQPAVQKLVRTKLGHDWQTHSVLDKEPTFESEGERSVHCNRCDKRDKIESIPKLEADKDTQYTFRIVRSNTEILNVLNLSDLKIIIKNEQGDEVVRSNRENFANGVMKVLLKPQKYTAYIEGLPKGYSAQQSYSIDPGSIEKDLVVTASLQPASDITSETKYSVGSVLHDYTFKNINGDDVTLSELLATHKMVLLNFFYLDCPACQTEMPSLLKAYDIYKEDVAIVMLDVIDYDTPEKIKTDWIDRVWNQGLGGIPSSVCVVQDQTPRGASAQNYNNIANKFGFTAAPQNVVIDKEGVVCYVHTGAASEMTFRNMFQKYTSKPYYNEPEEPAQSASSETELVTRSLYAAPTRKEER